MALLVEFPTPSWRICEEWNILDIIAHIWTFGISVMSLISLKQAEATQYIPNQWCATTIALHFIPSLQPSTYLDRVMLHQHNCFTKRKNYTFRNVESNNHVADFSYIFKDIIWIPTVIHAKHVSTVLKEAPCYFL